ncbi:MAG: hypothetical protein ACLUFN_02605 [Eubacterium sp.]
MSSTNKTSLLKLNSWIGSDIPQREDFNNDNQIIDDVISSHLSDSNLHTSASEKNIWNTPYAITTYYGNGSSSRTLALSTNFNPTWGIIFAVGRPIQIVDVDNQADYNYCGIFSTRGSTTGVSIVGKNVQLVQSSSALFGNEYRSFNENGVTYVCIAFR